MVNKDYHKCYIIYITRNDTSKQVNIHFCSLLQINTKTRTKRIGTVM